MNTTLLRTIIAGALGSCLPLPQALAATADCYAIRAPDKRNVCLAIKTAQTPYCQAVRSQDTKNFCLAVVTTREAYCLSIQDEDDRHLCLALTR